MDKVMRKLLESIIPVLSIGLSCFSGISLFWHMHWNICVEHGRLWTGIRSDGK